MLHSARKAHEEAVTKAQAEMMARLRSRTGLSTGRRTAYAKAPADVMRHLRRITSSVLERGAQ